MIARCKDGSTINYDRKEQHGDQVLFFREPIGLIHAKHIDEVEDYDISSSTDGSAEPAV